jgi:predicted GNAT family acetyltransferase
MFIGAAMPVNTSLGFADLRGLVAADEIIGVMGLLPEDLPGWRVLQVDQVRQLICEDLKPAARVDAVVLTKEDVPEMLELVHLAQPGPFLPRTVEMGRYLGLRQDGRLVAMAGERLHLTGFCEVSAVCTHPDYRGRGYGGALTTMVTEAILDRQETPFLHVAPGNDGALNLYIKLGFRIRREVRISILQKPAQ